MKTSNILMIIFIGVSLLLSILTYIYFPFYKLNGFDKGLEGVLLFASISLGFYGACLSVLASIFHTKVVRTIMSDKEEKKEFSIIVFSTLISGFITVFLTIGFRVILGSSILKEHLKLINSLWVFFTLLFVSMNFLFVLISFLIFFKNTEIKKDSVYKPILKDVK
ncbi:hypothetical protein [Lysinibacillus endophyticus]|uniref:hypothetical protein n=1 Tax=Ureibacillus endophyticus TaxID=1978490 RepID=UPI00209C6FE8|nr:hypothetical protein [Lysinibacillus endophyticus]MCP1144862.1 hypothetical protein [Lysinibacillus endophyticus]